jgi:hypothetical protein
MSAYDELADLAERELAVVRAGRHQDLYALHLERDAVMLGLPASAPGEAHGALLRASVAQSEIVATLAEAREATGRELSRLQRGRGAVRAYGHVGSGAVASADRRA